jgi:hypothetical protein
MTWAIPLSFLAIHTIAYSSLVSSSLRSPAHFVGLPNTLITPGPRHADTPRSVPLTPPVHPWDTPPGRGPLTSCHQADSAVGKEP